MCSGVKRGVGGVRSWSDLTADYNLKAVVCP